MKKEISPIHIQALEDLGNLYLTEYNSVKPKKTKQGSAKLKKTELSSVYGPEIWKFEETNTNELLKKVKEKQRTLNTQRIDKPEKLINSTVKIQAQGTKEKEYALDQRKLKLNPAPEPGMLYKCIRGYLQGVTADKIYHKIVSCGKENCKTCGCDYSIVHNRRINRSYAKVLQMKKVGYLVVTTPASLRNAFLCKQALQDFRNFVRRKLKRDYNTRGLVRYHWCGDDCTTWKPHLNILMEMGWLTAKKLEKFRNEVAAWFTSHFNLSEPVPGNIYYAYANNDGGEGSKKIKHWLNYVLRPTAKFVTDVAILDTIKGYKNTGYFGTFEKGEIERDSGTAILAGVDPETGEIINWAGGMIKPSIFNLEFRQWAKEIYIQKKPNDPEIPIGIYCTLIRDLVPAGTQLAIIDQIPIFA